jgi:protein-S-isoprenylcysteine O-methyltransferase Ste14
VLQSRCSQSMLIGMDSNGTSSESNESPAQETAGVVAPPPILFAGTLALGLLASRAIKLPFLPARLARPIGLSLLVGGLGFGGWGFSTLRGAGTNVSPHEPTLVLVDTGPFRYTRNPLYVSLTLMYLGIAALARAPVPLVLLGPLLAVLERGVIEREERYLERRFGDAYRAYKNRVPRWLWSKIIRSSAVAE